jgi:1,4-alpha-glucan branching enzyme
MSTIPVRFVYRTGIAREVFANPRLCGNWAGGRQSDHWTQVPMTVITADDRCPAFTATVRFEADQLGRTFRWGIVADGPCGKDQCIIMTEVRDARSTDRARSFTLAADNPDQVYRLSVARWLGAQKAYPNGADHPGQLRFAVWAPNAQKVEVVIGRLWLASDARVKGPVNPPGRAQSVPFNQLRGGYIANDGDGELPGQQHVPMHDRDRDGVWESEPAEPLWFDKYDHRPYMYLVNKDNGDRVYRTDIHSRCQIGGGGKDPGGAHFDESPAVLDGRRSCSVIVNQNTVTREDMISSDPGRTWPEEFVEGGFWQGLERPARLPGKTYPGQVEDLVIYELHLGALGFNRVNADGNPVPGTLEDALAFIDHLAELGVNAVELLPLSEFGGGGGGWGYATSHYYAIEYAGGGRDCFKKFIRECHRKGLAVIMDVVYNHYTHEGDRDQWMFDTTDHARNCYYWYEGRTGDYPGFDAARPDQAGQGGYLDNLSTAYAPRYWEEVVRQTFISSALTLMEEFHVDGFRVDQTTSIHAYNVRHADGQAVGSANVFGAKLLREFCRTLRAVRPDVMLMAEDHSTWDAVIRPVGDGGLGFDSRWYADFYHHLVGDTDKASDYAKLLWVAGHGGDEALALDYFAGAMNATGNHTVAYHKSHDEAGNGKYTHRLMYTAVNGAPLVGATRRYAEARCRFVAGMALLSGGTPMFLFGEEVGSTREFLYNRVLENREDLVGESRAESGKYLYRFYQELIRLRLGNPGLRSRNVQVLYVHNANRVIAFRRWSDGPGGEAFLVVGSLNNRPFGSGYFIPTGALANTSWREVFNSDAAGYNGDNVGNYGATIPGDGYGIKMVLPVNGFLVLKQV